MAMVFDVHVKSIAFSSEDEADAAGEAKATVVFRVSREDVTFDVPIPVSLAHFDETDVVKAGRHFFHGLTTYLAEQTAEWKQPNAWIVAGSQGRD